MSQIDSPDVPQLVARIRSGDSRAAEELVRRYEPLIRREVRFRLEDSRLRRVFDSMDICQSVLGSFFLRAAAGQFDLEDSNQLPKLLVSITRNKVASQARRQTSQKRDQRRNAGSDPDGLAAIPGREETPSMIVAGDELIHRFRAGLDSEELALADLRAGGIGWSEIAERLGGTAQARRMQLARAVDRMAKTLGVDGASDE